jgi:arylsulfatase A-like enzyme
MSSKTIAIPDELAVLLGSSLSSAALNLGASLLLSSFGQDHLSSFVLNLAATLACTLAIHLGLWFGIGQLLARVTSLSRQQVLLSLCGAVIAASAMLPLVDYSARADGEKTGFLVLLGALLVGIIAFLTAIAAPHLHRYLEAHPSWRALVLALPVVAVMAAIVLWLFVAVIEVRADATGLPTIAAIAVVLSLLLVTALAVMAARSVLVAGRPALVLAVVSLLVFVAPGIGWMAALAGAEEPNFKGRPPGVKTVILLTVDTLRADLVDAQAPESITPHIDALAEDSVVFRHARSAAGWTKPAMASMFTGLSPDIHRATTLRSSLPEQVVTLAERLGGGGYRTIGIGRNGSLREPFNFDQGFDEFHLFAGSVTVNPSLGTRLLRALGRGVVAPTSSELAELGSEEIQENASRPFFLWLHFLDPHVPYSPPLEELGGLQAPPGFSNSFDEAQEVRSGRLWLSARGKAWVEELYRAEMRYVDKCVGDVLDTLRELNLYEDALIVFSSDHGEEFFEHGSFEHGHSLYDEVLRVPLMFKLPAAEFAGELDTPVSTESITPTLVDLLDLAAGSDDFTARSLTTAWQGESPVEEPVVSTGLLYYRNMISVVFDGKKYIRWLDKEHEELFSLSDDPRETTSIALENRLAVSMARQILAAHEERSSELRRRLEIDPQSEDSLKPEVIEDLRALGYIE